MSTKYAKASLIVVGFASISIALMAAFGSSITAAYAASPAQQQQPLALPTDTPLPPPPTNTPVIPPENPTVTPVIPGGGDAPRFADPYVFKSADVAQVKPGETINFTIVVGNRGNVDAVNVQVRDTLPDYLDLVSVVTSKGTVSINGRGFLVDIGTVGVAELITIKVTAMGNSTMKAGACTNVATLNTTSGGDNPNNNTSFANYVCGEVVNPPTGGAPADNSGLVIALLVAGLLMIGASFLLTGNKSAPETKL